MIFGYELGFVAFKWPNLCLWVVILCPELQEAQLMLTNPSDAFRGQSRSPNIVPFHMIGIVSSCAIVTLSLRYLTSEMS